MEYRRRDVEQNLLDLARHFGMVTWAEATWQAPRKIHHPRKPLENPLLVPNQPCEFRTLALSPQRDCLEQGN